MNPLVQQLSRIGSSLSRAGRWALDPLIRAPHRRDERDASIADTDHNASSWAAASQSRSDARDEAAGNPADEGGQG